MRTAAAIVAEMMEQAARLPEREGLTMAEAFAQLPGPLRVILEMAHDKANEQWGGEWRNAEWKAMRLSETTQDVRDALTVLRALQLPGCEL